jgi:hypothetical protein
MIVLYEEMLLSFKQHWIEVHLAVTLRPATQTIILNAQKSVEVIPRRCK